MFCGNQILLADFSEKDVNCACTPALYKPIPESTFVNIETGDVECQEFTPVSI
jgi:hypothetical protein